ncbi:hypothetical protein B0H13DRAFT_1888360 [Mycena leptocephala]|nr:hypothetical protein B0H13DRAFT_1888360 [Mycena leptocephala]
MINRKQQSRFILLPPPLRTSESPCSSLPPVIHSAHGPRPARSSAPPLHQLRRSHHRPRLPDDGALPWHAQLDAGFHVLKREQAEILRGYHDAKLQRFAQLEARMKEVERRIQSLDRGGITESP